MEGSEPKAVTELEGWFKALSRSKFQALRIFQFFCAESIEAWKSNNGGFKEDLLLSNFFIIGGISICGNNGGFFDGGFGTWI